MQVQEHIPKTPVWRIDPERPEIELITYATSVIAAGGVVVYPTETFYALGANPLTEAAIQRVYGIKGRDFDKPLPLIASGLDSVQKIVREWPAAAQTLAEAFWPGPLTLVLPAAPELPSLLHGGTGKIAVRISSHPVAHILSAASGGLLISTSANVSGMPAFSDADRIPASLLSQVDGFLHAGVLPGGLPSTLVDLTFSPPRLIRAGPVSWESIKTVCGS